MKNNLRAFSLLGFVSLAACGGATVDYPGGGDQPDPGTTVGQPGAPLPEIKVDLKTKVVPGPGLTFTSQQRTQKLGWLTMSTAEPCRSDALTLCTEGTGPIKVTLSEDGNGNYPKTFGEVVLDQASRCATMQTNRTSSPFAPLNISRQPTTYLVSVELLDLTQRGSRLTLSITGGIFSNQNNKQYAAMWNDPLGRTNQLNIPIVVQ